VRPMACGWAVLIMVLSRLASAQAAAPMSPQTTFFHANALYKDGQYAAAARDYEELLEAGFESGNLYFNLGNAYFKAGQRGRAILSYERARRFIPGDPDLEANLAYAQSLTEAEPCAPPLWRRIAFPLAHRVGLSRLLWTTSGLYTLLFVAVATYRLWSRRPRWLRSASIALAVVVALASASLAEQTVTDRWQRSAVVIKSGDTDVRFEPAEDGTVHFVLKEGSFLRIVERRQGWVEVARCDGRRGWVEAATIEER
jgi:tetratricopeptide (TPR) repeat protein